MGWNKGAEIIFGYSEDEVSGKPFTTLMPERYRKQQAKVLKRLISQKEDGSDGFCNSVEIMRLRKDGSEFPSVLLLFTRKKDIDAVFTGIVSDVSSGKPTEAA